MNKRKLNILYITTATKMFGSEKSLFEMVKGMGSGANCIVITPNLSNEVCQKFTDAGIRTCPVDLNSQNMIQNTKQLMKIINENKIDLMHVNYDQNLAKVIVAAKLAKIPIVVHMRMAADISISTYFLLKFVNRVICVSEVVKRGILNTRRMKGLLPVRLNNMCVIYNGRDLTAMDAIGSRDQFRNEFLLKEKDFAIGMVGAIAPRKRQDLFLRVAANLNTRIQNVRFFIVGDLYGQRHAAYAEHVKVLAEELGLNGNLHFTGRRDDIASVMKGLDLLLMLSDKEGWGGVVIEANAVRTPVIGTDNAHTAMSEVVGKDHREFLLDNDDVGHIVGKIVPIIENRELYKKLSDISYQQSLRFDIKHTVNEMKDLYQETVMGDESQASI